MEFADGGDLAHVIEKHKQQRRNVDEAFIWAVLMQLLDGLEALHSRRIIHRGNEQVAVPHRCRSTLVRRVFTQTAACATHMP